MPHRCSVGFVLRTSESTLQIIQLNQAGEGVQVTTLPAIPATSIASVQATRSVEGIKDLLVLHTDGSLSLVIPGGDMEVDVDNVLFASGQNAPCAGRIVPRRGGVRVLQDGALPLPSKLVNAVGALVSVMFSNGVSLRVTTDLSPRSALVRSAFVTMSHLCSSTLIFETRQRYLNSIWRRKGCDSFEEFQCFSNALLSVLEFDPMEALTSSIATHGWSQMARHSVHRRLFNDQALRALRLPQDPQAISPMIHQHREIIQVLHSLHLLGEELKVDGLRRHELPILVPLLIQLAYPVGTDWVEYWLRTCPDVVDDWRLSDFSAC